MKKELLDRDSNFELLRIVSMLMIIAHHFFCYSRYSFSLPFNISDGALLFIQSGGKLGAILFIMVTGYYMVQKKEIKIRKLVEFELIVLYYSIVLFLLGILLFHKRINSGDILQIFLPNMLKTYWFFSGYFFIYLIIPYLNKFISSINKDEMRKFLIIGFVFLIFIPTICISNDAISETVYLLYYYLVGAYISLYYKKNTVNKYKCLLIGSGFYLLIILFTFNAIYLSFNEPLWRYKMYCFSGMQSVFVFGSGISLFLFFKGIEVRKSKILNYIASFSFGVFLFHEHIFMKEYMWNNLFPLSKIIGHGSLLLNAFCIAIIVYIMGSIFEFIRKLLFDGVKKIFKLKDC